MLTDERQEFEQSGYVIRREFAGGAELDRLRDEIERFITNVVPGIPERDTVYANRRDRIALRQIFRMEQHDEYFRRLGQESTWLRFAEKLIGPAQCHAVEWFDKPPGDSRPTPPHQDNYYFGLTPPDVVTIWLALDAIDAENGGLRYVAGSHLRGLRPHELSSVLGFSQTIVDFGPADLALETLVALQPGDAVAHHGLPIHRAEENRSGQRHRRALAMVFRGQHCRRCESAAQSYAEGLRRQQRSRGND